VTEAHDDFWQVTQDGLDWALEKAGHGGDAALRERLLALYWELACYPEVPAMLQKLKSHGMNTAILSNGSPKMLAGAVNSAGIGALLDDTLSVESVGVFKPDARVYDLVGARFEGPRDSVLFVSSNGWDAAGAAAYGFATVWVNRAGEPMDRLPARPAHVLADLTTIPDLART
jgi:2-haloacid dehalogenase